MYECDEHIEEVTLCIMNLSFLLFLNMQGYGFLISVSPQNKKLNYNFMQL
jgi:hypothetical protein